MNTVKVLISRTPDVTGIVSYEPIDIPVSVKGMDIIADVDDDFFKDVQTIYLDGEVYYDFTKTMTNLNYIEGVYMYLISLDKIKKDYENNT